MARHDRRDIPWSHQCALDPQEDKQIPWKMVFWIAGFGWLWQDASMKSVKICSIPFLFPSLHDGSTWLEVTRSDSTSPDTTPHSCFVSWLNLISAKIRRRSCWCICQTLRAQTSLCSCFHLPKSGQSDKLWLTIVVFGFEVIFENYFSYGLTIYINRTIFPPNLDARSIASTLPLLGNHLRTWTAAKASTMPLSKKAKSSRSRLSIPNSNHVKSSEGTNYMISNEWIWKWEVKYHFCIGLADPGKEVPTAQLEQRHQTTWNQQPSTTTLKTCLHLTCSLLAWEARRPRKTRASKMTAIGLTPCLSTTEAPF